MIATGIRLTVAAAKAAALRVALTVIGVGFVVALLIGAMGVSSALAKEEDQRARRLYPISPVASGEEDVLLWDFAANPDPIGVGGELITVAVAATGPDAPRPLGAPRPPESGTVLVSPALAELLDSPDGKVHRARLPGPIVGRLSPEILATPDDLVLMVGWDADALMSVSSDAQSLTILPEIGDPPVVAPAVVSERVLAALVGIVMILPLLVILRSTSLLASERRESRTSALALVGATPRQVRAFAGIEGAIFGFAGSALGLTSVILAPALIPTLNLGGLSLFTADLRPGWAIGMGVPIGVVILSSLLASTTLVKSKRRRPVHQFRPPRLVDILRLLPLGGGVVALSLAAFGRDRIEGQIQVVIVAAGLTALIVGVILITPLLLAGVIGRLPRDLPVPGGLARARIRLDINGSARALSGVVAGIFALTMAAIYFPSHNAWAAAPEATTAAAVPSATAAEFLVVASPPLPAGVADRVASVEGVSAVYPVVLVPADAGQGDSLIRVAVATCAELHVALEVPNDCPAAEAAVAPSLAGGGLNLKIGDGVSLAAGPSATLASPLLNVDAVVPPQAVPDLLTLPVEQMIIEADSEVATAEQVRQVLLANYGPGPTVSAPTDVLTDQASFNERDHNRTTLAASFVICVTVVGFAIAIGERIISRRRVFSQLLAIGVTPRQLRTALFLESIVPLVGMATIAMAIAALAAIGILAIPGIPMAVAGADLLTVLAAVTLPILVVLVVSLPLVARAIDPTGLRTE